MQRAIPWYRAGLTWIRNQELVILMLMLGLVLGFWTFFELADEVREGQTRQADEWVLRKLRDPNDLASPIGPPWLQNSVRDITALGSTVVLMLLSAAVLGFLLLKRQYHAALFLLIAIATSVLLNNLLKTWFARERPAIVPHLDHVDSRSFPSGHTFLSSVIYLTLAAVAARLTEQRHHRVYIISVALALVFLIGLSRLYLGVHYPTDVLAGWSLGIAWAIGCWFFARWLQRRGAVEKGGKATDQ
jgi:undecaprenyl-diphosphatase